MTLKHALTVHPWYFKKSKQNEFKFILCFVENFRVYFFSDKSYIAIGSFSHLFVVLDQHGKDMFNLNLPDNIQSMTLYSEIHNLLFIGCFDGCMYAINFQTGRISWKFSTGNSIVSSPKFCHKNSSILFGSYAQNIYCLQLKVSKTVGKVISTDILCFGQKLFSHLITSVVMFIH